MSFELTLPPNYPKSDILAFHARDTEALAERVGPDFIQKGFVVETKPVVLEIRFASRKAVCRIDADGPLSSNGRASIKESARKMLGLLIEEAAFERSVKKDKLLGPLVKRQNGLRIPQVATVFEALSWAVIGQQIHLNFAIALRRTFICLSGRKHSSGLFCFPDAEAVSRLDREELGRNQFSHAKAETLVRIAELVTSGELELEPKEPHSPETISASLLAIKGIGPWTVNYTLLRGYGFADASLHGDSAVRSALQKLSGKKYDAGQTERLLKKYAPHRSLAAAHLWNSLKKQSD
ncbi:MAG: DNA-3-methyladenine glycosylase 2 [Spirochaetia bacterium]|nr:DNA-3-methyladenine glycosylase 2 [Spirochaetia bacterium]